MPDKNKDYVNKIEFLIFCSDTKNRPCISRPLSQKEITAIRDQALDLHFTIK